MMATDQDYSEILGMEITAALKEITLPRPIYERILKSSFPATQASLLEMEASVRSHDWARVREIAHDLAGVYANLRVKPVAALASEAGALVRAGAPEEQVLDVVGKLKGRFEAMQAAFSQ
jgi:HPt (histidine-containing phosphotransfer) domain-containing protein